MFFSTRSGRLARSLPEADSCPGVPVNSVLVCGTSAKQSRLARTVAVTMMSALSGRLGPRPIGAHVELEEVEDLGLQGYPGVEVIHLEVDCALPYSPR